MIVDVRGVSVEIDDIPLLREVNLDLSTGEIVALTGPNGSGKTTLLKTIAGLLPPSTGTVRVAGRQPRDRDPSFRGKLAALIGVPPLARNLTLREHLELISISWGSSQSSASKHASLLLKSFGILPFELRFPHELSSGQQQLFFLCLTLIRPCEVLLLDEPEQRLDADRRVVLAAALRSRAEAGTAILMATHSTELAEGTGARVVSLDSEIA